MQRNTSQNITFYEVERCGLFLLCTFFLCCLSHTLSFIVDIFLFFFLSLLLLFGIELCGTIKMPGTQSSKRLEVSMKNSKKESQKENNLIQHIWNHKQFVNWLFIVAPFAWRPNQMTAILFVNLWQFFIFLGMSYFNLSSLTIAFIMSLSTLNII